MQLNFWILRGKSIESRRGKQRVQPVRDADAHGAFRLGSLRLQLACDRMERVIQPAQGLRERLSAAGQCDPARRRNEELRADHVLQALDLPAHPRLAGVGDLGGTVERLGLGDGEKDAQFSPVLSAQKILVVERAPVERLLFLVEWIHGFHIQVEGATTHSSTGSEGGHMISFGTELSR